MTDETILQQAQELENARDDMGELQITIDEVFTLKLPSSSPFPLVLLKGIVHR